MADLYCDWQGDLVLTPSGDLMLADGNQMVEQHIIRRLLTAVRAYVWAPGYGAGLPQRIGRVARARDIRSIVLSQIALEQTVAAVPVPAVTVNEDETVFGLFNIAITYTNAATGQAVSLQFEVPTTS